MASKVNKQFILLLFTVCTALAIVVGGLAWWARRNDATRNVRNGDAAMAAGDFERAADQYGRAVRKEPSSIDYLDMFESAIREIRPDTRSKAQEWYRQWLSALYQRTQLQPENAEFHLALMRELRQNAELTGSEGYWGEVSDHAERAVARVDSTDPARLEIEAMSLIADARRSSAMTASDRESLRNDLEEFIRNHPDHAEVIGEAAQWYISQAVREFFSQRTDNAARTIEDAERLIAQGKQVDPDSFAVVMSEVQHRFSAPVLQERPIEQEEANALADRLYDVARKDLRPATVSRCAVVLPLMVGRRGHELALDLAELYLEAEPESFIAEHQVADSALKLGDLERAREHAAAVMDSEPVPTSFMAQFRHELRERAAKILFDVEFIAAMQETDADARTAAIETARDARDRLAQVVSDPDNNIQVREADAWMYYIAGDTQQAAGAFNDVIQAHRQRQTLPPGRVLWAAGEVMAAEGAPGQAIVLMREATSQLGQQVSLLVTLARLEQEQGDFEQAYTHAEAALAIEPEHELAQTILADAATRLNRPIETAGATQTLVRAQQLWDSGDLDGARDILLQAAESDPTNMRLQAALVQVDVAAERRDDAIARLESLIDQFPNQAQWQELLLRLRGEDEVEIAKRVAEMRFDDPAERAVQMWAMLSRTARARQAQATDARARNRNEQATTLEALAQRYADEAAVVHGQIPETARDTHPDYLSERLNQALEGGDTTEARRIVQTARERNVDQANGLTYKARMELASGDFEAAAVTLDDASRLKPYSNWVWRSLGLTYENLGNKPAAIDAYQKAIAQAPNDPTTVQLLGRILNEVGRRAEALELFRRAARTPGASASLVDQWLLLEGDADVGNPYIALTERADTYRSTPSDRNNALQYALLLGRVVPDQRSILKPDGTPRYSERQWQTMRPAERQAAVEAAREEWLQTAESIFTSLGADDTDDIALCLTRATYLRESGQTGRARSLMEQFVSTHGPAQQDPNIYLAHAQFLSETGDNEAAIATLREGRPYQSVKLEIDRALGSVLYSSGDYNGALEYLQAVADATNDSTVRLQSIEARYNLEQFAEVEQALNAYEEANGTSFEVEILRARAKFDRAAAMFSSENDAEARRVEQEGMVAIDTAAALRPSSPWPPTLRASAKLREYLRDGRSRPALLDDAQLELSKAIQLESGFMPARRLQSQILLSKSPPDFQGAIAQWEVALRNNPRDAQAREYLVQLARGANNLPYAAELAIEGTRLHPQSALWYKTAGDALFDMRQFERAAEQYDAGFQRTGMGGFLRFWGLAMLAQRPPKAAEVITRLNEHQSLFNEVISLRPILARALVAAGNFNEAVRHIKLSYAEHAALDKERGGFGSVAQWYLELQRVYQNRTPEEVDSVVRELTGGEMTVNDRYHLATIWLIMADEDGVDPAIALLTEALEQVDEDAKGDLVLLNTQLGRAYWRGRRNQEAADAFLRALAVNPNNAAAQNDLAYLYVVDMNDPEKALPHAQKAVELDPLNPGILDTLGAVYLAMDDLEKAEVTLRQSADIRPMADNHLHLGELYLKRGDTGRAKQYLEQALQLNPNQRTQTDIQALLDDIDS